MRLPRALVCAAGLAGCGNLGIDSDSNGSTSGGSTSTSAESTSGPPPTTTFEVVCEPGQQRCFDADSREVCTATGLEWEQVPCTKYQKCSETGDPVVAACLGPCEDPAESSLGCEFLAIRMRSGNGEDPEEVADAIIVGNTDAEKTAEVQLYFVPNYFNVEEPQGDPIVLQPGQSAKFDLTNDTMPNYSSFRSGGVYHVVSDYPVAAYLHSPLDNSNSNDASLLLPVKTYGTDYVITSYVPYALPEDDPDYNPEYVYGRPSYFVVIATENDTTVSWTPPNATAGDGIAVFSVDAGQKSKDYKLNRYDTLMIGASAKADPDYTTHDVSGTILHASKPVAVMGAVSCAAVPVGAKSCSHLQEQVLPLKYWGTQYVAAHPPIRGNEMHYWRVFAGDNNVTIAMDPAPQGLPPFTLDKIGDYKDVVAPNNFNFTFQSTGSKAFMPVQYLAARTVAANTGDPSMLQTIAVEQQLKRYVFVTGRSYEKNYVQVLRKFKGAEVTLDGAQVSGYEFINATNELQYEVATILLTTPDDAVHVAESDDPFAINVIGFASSSAYAYPGGMALKVINL